MKKENIELESIEKQVPPSSKILNQVAEPVDVKDIKSPEIQKLISKLLIVAKGRQGDASFPTLVGLAAPQIGFSKRIVIIGTNSVGDGKQPQLEVFINPELTNFSEDTVDGREGCFSTSRVCGIVERFSQVTIEAYDKNGIKFKRILEGFPARIAQHEIDHLNGTRFPDRIKDDSMLHWVEEDQFGEYRKNWKSWATLCPRSKWLAIKSAEY